MLRQVGGNQISGRRTHRNHLVQCLSDLVAAKLKDSFPDPSPDPLHQNVQGVTPKKGYFKNCPKCMQPSLGTSAASTLDCIHRLCYK